MTVYVHLVLSSYFSFFFFFCLLKKECSEGWTLNDGSCYWLNKDFLSWDEAEVCFNASLFWDFMQYFFAKGTHFVERQANFH